MFALTPNQSSSCFTVRPPWSNTSLALATIQQIAEALYAHAGFREVREVVFALPFSFEHEDYVQILTDIATHLGPVLGWTPSGG